MTLLESVIALVILSLSAIGALEVFQQTNRSVEEAREWTVATAYAEQGIEAAKTGMPALIEALAAPLAAGYSRKIITSPEQFGLNDVSVVVGLPNGASLTVHRLMLPR